MRWRSTRQHLNTCQRNIIENHVADRVRAEVGDCRALLSGVYDRFLMGHFDAPSMLADALAHVRSGSVLHVHSIGDAEPTIGEAVAEAGFWRRSPSRRVKKYGPARVAYGAGCDDIVKRLSGKTVVLAVTGSIAAVETVKLAHALRRRVRRCRRS